MPAVNNNRSDKPYLSIVGGKWSMTVDKGTPKAQHREYELSNGNKGEKWEIINDAWNGNVIGITFEDTDFGKFCKVELQDAILSINTDSRFFQHLAGKLHSADLNKSINFAPYDFESDDGKKIKGMNLWQNEVKIENSFYDAENKQFVDEYPKPENQNMDKDDWKSFYIQVKKFLIKKLQELKIPEYTQPANTEIAGVELKYRTEDAAKSLETGEEIKLDDLPFNLTEKSENYTIREDSPSF